MKNKTTTRIVEIDGVLVEVTVYPEKVRRKKEVNVVSTARRCRQPKPRKIITNKVVNL